jgi:transcriptional regulator with XRE-family HTH domain
VRACRQAHGISQTKLADAVGLTFQQIQIYEKGSNRISASRLQQFSNILGVPVAFFFNDPPSSASQRKKKSAGPAITHISEFISTVDGRDFMKAYIKLKDAKLRRGIAAYIEELAAR